MSTSETTLADLVGHEKDRCRKLDAVLDVTPHLTSYFQQGSIVDWDKLDSQPTSNILETAIHCLHAGRLEDAALGILYLLYQKKVETTNKADEAQGRLF